MTVVGAEGEMRISSPSKISHTWALFPPESQRVMPTERKSMAAPCRQEANNSHRCSTWLPQRGGCHVRERWFHQTRRGPPHKAREGDMFSPLPPECPSTLDQAIGATSPICPESLKIKSKFEISEGLNHNNKMRLIQ